MFVHVRRFFFLKRAVGATPDVAPRAPFPTFFHEQPLNHRGGRANPKHDLDDFGPVLRRQTHLTKMAFSETSPQLNTSTNDEVDDFGSVSIRQACSPQMTSWDAPIPSTSIIFPD